MWGAWQRGRSSAVVPQASAPASSGGVSPPGPVLWGRLPACRFGRHLAARSYAGRRMRQSWNTGQGCPVNRQARMPAPHCGGGSPPGPVAWARTPRHSQARRRRYVGAARRAPLAPGRFRPALFPHRPATLLGRPATLLGRPATLLGRPATLLDRPATLLDRPATFLGRPTTFLGRPATLLLYPATHLGRPAMLLGRPATHLGCPARGRTMGKWCRMLQMRCRWSGKGCRTPKECCRTLGKRCRTQTI